jgi:shikimate kinase
MSERGEAVAYGAVTIVNALATGKGAAFGIDLWTKARVELTNDGAVETTISNEKDENTLLVEKCVRAVFNRFGARTLGAKVQTESNIPIARGLKSSSVAGNAVVLATLAALDKPMDPSEILNLVVDASLEAKVSVTGAFDDASASLYGNVVVTDNMARKVLRAFPVEEYCVLLLVPREKSYTIEVDMARIKTVARQVDVAYKEAFDGNYWSAMTLNGLIYSQVLRLATDVIIESLEAGAMAAGVSGKGPAYAFVVEEEVKETVLSVLREHEGQVIVSRTRRHSSLSMPTLEPRGFLAIGDDNTPQ